MASCESIGRELSFEWWHHRISSIESKDQNPQQTANPSKQSGSERVKVLTLWIVFLCEFLTYDILLLLGTNANWYRPNSFTQYRVKQTRRKRRELVPPPVSMANEFYTNIALQVRVSPNSSDVVIFLASNSLGTEFNRIDVSQTDY